MRISDWSSDVCSSDLPCRRSRSSAQTRLCMELWIPITIVGAFMQNIRSAVQKHLKGRLTTLGAAYVRFLYAAPFALLYLFSLKSATGLPWPEPNLTFLAYCIAGGIAQIMFTALLVWLFSFRNFAVGTTYSQTEAIGRAPCRDRVCPYV